MQVGSEREVSKRRKVFWRELEWEEDWLEGKGRRVRERKLNEKNKA